jgi:hypothetical protein
VQKVTSLAGNFGPAEPANGAGLVTFCHESGGKPIPGGGNTITEWLRCGRCWQPARDCPEMAALITRCQRGGAAAVQIGGSLARRGYAALL